MFWFEPTVTKNLPSLESIQVDVRSAAVDMAQRADTLDAIACAKNAVARHGISPDFATFLSTVNNGALARACPSLRKVIVSGKSHSAHASLSGDVMTELKGLSVGTEALDAWLVRHKTLLTVLSFFFTPTIIIPIVVYSTLNGLYWRKFEEARAEVIPIKDAKLYVDQLRRAADLMQNIALYSYSTGKMVTLDEITDAVNRANIGLSIEGETIKVDDVANTSETTIRAAGYNVSSAVSITKDINSVVKSSAKTITKSSEVIAKAISAADKSDPEVAKMAAFVAKLDTDILKLVADKARVITNTAMNLEKTASHIKEHGE